MSNIKMTLIEDIQVKWSKLEAVAESETNNELTFDWHNSAKESVTGRTIFEKFKTFLSGEEVEGWGKMLGQWIVFTDLGLGQEVTLDPDEAAEARSWFKDLEPDFDVSADTLAGLYLAGLAMRAEWEGLVVIASGQGSGHVIKAYEKLQELFGRPNSKALFKCQGSFTTLPERCLASGKEAFGRLFPDQIEKRIWPDSTSGWFDDDLPGQAVPHDPPVYGEPEWAVCQSALRDYLSKLFRFLPEESWLSEQQLPFLHCAIKGLVGACTDVQGPRDETSRLRVGTSQHRLTLGGAVLLLAVAEGAPRDWMAQFVWKETTREILPEQTSAQAESAAKALFNFLKAIVPKREGIPNLQLKKLEIEVGFSSTDIPDGNPTRGSFITRILEMRPSDGMAFTAYRNFFVAAAAAQHQGREAACVVNVLPTKENKSLIQVVSCK